MNVIYRSISPGQYAAIQAKCASNGIVLEGSSGSASAHGVDVDYVYNTDTGILTLTVTGKPFFIQVGTVIGELGKLLDGALNTPSAS